MSPSATKVTVWEEHLQDLQLADPSKLSRHLRVPAEKRIVKELGFRSLK